MRSRTPTKSEKLYIEASKSAVGCVACDILGHPNDAPPEYLAFHHNPDIGNNDKLCHFFGFPLCPVHHQGVTPSGMVIPPSEPIRHPPLGMPRRSFAEAVGTDLDLARIVWERIPCSVTEQIGEATNIYDFDDLVNFYQQHDVALKN